jgi:signal transduction histidine kinase/CheY-like chemotaxis protein
MLIGPAIIVTLNGLTLGIIAGLIAVALLIGYRLLLAQLINPLRTVREELRVANNDLRRMSNEVAEARAKVARLEDELITTARAKSAFLTNMSHRLRTPLNSILGYSEMLNKGIYGELSERQKNRVDKILDNGLGLLALINDILDLNRIEGGRLELDLSTVRVGGLIESLLADLQQDAARKNLELKSALARPLRVIHADEMRVRQIAQNLLTHALQSTLAGSIEVAARNVTVKGGKSKDFALPVLGWLPDRDWLLISVTDTGIGIPPEQQATIFEEFRTDDDRQNLGLAVTRKLVELHTGRIWVQSQVGKGSTFYVALPAQDEFEPYEGETVQNVALEKALAMVLVITDDNETALTLRFTLENRQYFVARAHDAAAGLARAHELHPAVILVDMLMPGLAGWDAVRRLKDDPTTAPIPILLTIVRENKVYGFPLGACACISKPVQRDELLAAVAHVQEAPLDRPVLIVDDDPAERRLLRDFLKSEDLSLINVETGQAARQWVQTSDQVAGMVLLDLLMPDANGFELLRALRAAPRLAQVPVILLYPDSERLSAADAAALRDGVTQTLADAQDDLLANLSASLAQTLT